MTGVPPYSHDTRLKDAFVYLDDSQTPAPRFYHNPLEIIRADRPEQVDPAFARLKRAHETGHYLVGYISYELGLTLEDRLASLVPQNDDQPLLCFGVFKDYSQDIPASLLYTAEPKGIELRPDWNQADYLERFKQVQAYLRAGDCYQINLTFPMRGTYDGDPLALYASLRHRQAAKYGGFVRLGGPDLLSLSPELFFKKNGQSMSMRPMKGTLKRDPDAAKDKALRAGMARDSKSRAENLMIVDLLRNDLSRLSKPGSVDVPELFSLETYPTLHQMTSRVVSELNDGTTFRQLFQSLFPCGSVTGAPKIRAMEIINELETAPRGPYCGALGYVDPNGDACFNVGIRTISLTGQDVSYHVGSGVVLDSNGADEYAECLLKADVLKSSEPYYIETLYWDKTAGYRNIGQHLARLSKAVQNNEIIQSAVEQLAKYRPAQSPSRIRLTVSQSAHVKITDTPLTPSQTPLKIALSKYPMTAALQSNQHKTSARDFYDGERARLQRLYDVDEVIFLNGKGELCEGSFTNIFLEKDGSLVTPPLSSGCLAGVLRAQMVALGKAKETILNLDDLNKSNTVYIGNSLRGLMPASLVKIER